MGEDGIVPSSPKPKRILGVYLAEAELGFWFEGKMELLCTKHS